MRLHAMTHSLTHLILDNKGKDHYFEEPILGSTCVLAYQEEPLIASFCLPTVYTTFIGSLVYQET